MTLTLPKELERSLTHEARRRGLTPDVYALRVLETNVPPVDQRQRLMTLLEARISGAESAVDEEDDPDALLQAIDSDRLSDRPLFPPEMKGVTW